MDRNMITVMTGQVVDFYDQDFRELYAVSEKLDLFKEFNVCPPTNVTATVRTKAGPKRPPLPATTSRFQVSLGDSRKGNIPVPAHKFYNPKYALAFGDIPLPPGSLQEPGPRRGSVLAEVPGDLGPGRPRVTSSERLYSTEPLPSEAPTESLEKPKDKRKRLTWKHKPSRKKSASKLSINSTGSGPSPVPPSPGPPSPSPTETNDLDQLGDSLDVIVKTPSKWRSKKLSKLGPRTQSALTVDTTWDDHSKCVLLSVVWGGRV